MQKKKKEEWMWPPGRRKVYKQLRETLSGHYKPCGLTRFGKLRASLEPCASLVRLTEAHESLGRYKSRFAGSWRLSGNLNLPVLADAAFYLDRPCSVNMGLTTATAPHEEKCRYGGGNGGES